MAGFCTSRMGFLMHMGNHSAISRSPFWNGFVGTFHNLIGSSWQIWTMEHQVAHHMHPNELGKDNDYSIGSPVLRFNRFIQHTPFHALNHVTTWLAMAGGTWRWYIADMSCIWNGEVGSVKWFSSSSDVLVLSLWKCFWLLRWMVIPIYNFGPFYGMVPSIIINTWAAYQMECTFIVNHIQTALEPDDKTHWSVRQIGTTTNWASGSLFWNWFSGGLNHQVEHHLFPSLTHHLYPLIHPIVLQTCKEFNIPFYNFKTYASAWKATNRHLETLAYDDTDPKRPTPIIPPNLCDKEKAKAA